MASTPPEIAARIRAAGRRKLRALIPLALALAGLGGVGLVFALGAQHAEWGQERNEAERRYDYYQRCRAGTMKGEYYCGKKGAPPPKPPPSWRDAPPCAQYAYSDLRGALAGCAAAVLVGGLLALILYLAARSRQNEARRQDPSRVVIEHSPALAILVWTVVPLVALIALAMGLSGPRSNRIMVPIGLALLVFPVVFQVVRHALQPREADAEGIRLGFGRVLRWRDFVGATDVTYRRRDDYGMPARVTGFACKLRFRNGTAKLEPLATSNWERVRDHINRHLGRPVV
jgi:hypothetical protein